MTRDQRSAPPRPNAAISTDSRRMRGSMLSSSERICGCGSFARSIASTASRESDSRCKRALTRANRTSTTASSTSGSSSATPSTPPSCSTTRATTYAHAASANAVRIVAAVADVARPDPQQRTPLPRRRQRVDPQQIGEQHEAGRDDDERDRAEQTVGGAATAACSSGASSDAVHQTGTHSAAVKTRSTIDRRRSPGGPHEIRGDVARGGPHPAFADEHGEQQRDDQPDAVALGRRPHAALEMRGRRAQHAEHDRDRERAGDEARRRPAAARAPRRDPMRPPGPSPPTARPRERYRTRVERSRCPARSRCGAAPAPASVNARLRITTHERRSV